MKDKKYLPIMKQMNNPIGFTALADVWKNFGHMSCGHLRMHCKQRLVSGVGGNVLPIQRIVKADRGK